IEAIVFDFMQAADAGTNQQPEVEEVRRSPSAAGRRVRRLFSGGRQFARSRWRRGSSSWHAMDADAVLDHHGCSRTAGLSAQAAAERLHKLGRNKLPQPVTRSRL